MPKDHEYTRNNGFDRPTYKGTVFGQTVCKDISYPTDRRRPFLPPDMPDCPENIIWLTIWEPRTTHYWIWDGSAWLLPEVFDTKYAKVACKRETTRFPSKNDIDANGMPNRFAGIKNGGIGKVKRKR